MEKMMKKAIAAVVLVLVSMTALANENKGKEKVQLDTSAINVKFEQVLNDRLRTELAVTNSKLMKQAYSNIETNLLMKTMHYFKVDTSLPE